MKERFSTLDEADVARFSALSAQWWDESGPFAPLHALNPCRIAYLRDRIAEHFGRDGESGKPFSGLTLLDVGCGGGLITEPMARLGATVTGIDASSENIGIAQAHAEQTGLDIAYRAVTTEALAAERHPGALAAADAHITQPSHIGDQDAANGGTLGAHPQFDIVLALEIIEHVADVPLFLESLSRLTKPGGLLIVSTLNRTAKSLLLAKIGAEYLLRWVPAGTHDWRQFLRPSEIVEPLEARGMKLSELAGMVYSPLKRSWRIEPRDLDVNYLAVFTQP